jgi:hypothetical protein
MVDKKKTSELEKAIKTIKLMGDSDVLQSLMNLKLGDVENKLLSKFKKIRKEAKGGMINKYAKGGEVKKYMGGGSVKKTPTTKRSIGPAGASTVKSKDDVGQTKGPAGMGKMITTKGWGASRKT